MTDAPPLANARWPFRNADGDFTLIWRLLHDYVGTHSPIVVAAQ